MVSTRRQSARLKTAPVAPDSDQDVIEPGSDSDSDLTSLESSDVEYESGHSDGATPSGRAPAKRVKTTASKDVVASKDPKPKPKPRKSRKNAATLSLLPSMSIDILFEIFGHVAPTDLLNLLRVNTALRSTLMGKSGTAISVWKAARKTYHDAPSPPKGFSEVRWASLLFGKHCQECDSHHYVQIDFALRRRLCSKCKKAQLISLSRFNVHFPFHEKSILELIPHTTAAEINLGFAGRTTKYYWEADIYDITTKLGKFESDVSLRKPAARQKLQAYREERVVFVENVLAHATKCRAWIEGLDAFKAAEEQEKQDARYEDMEGRFIEMGYTAADIKSALSYNKNVQKSTKLTNAVWNRISPDLERDIKRARTNRLEREHRDLMTARRDIVRALYRNYHRTLLPSQWAYMPPIEVVYDFPGIKALLFAEASVSITAESFEDEVSILPETISGWAAARRDLLRTSLQDGLTKLPSLGQPGTPGTSGGTTSTSIDPASAGGSSQVAKDRLELATAVFTCPEGYSCMERNAALISSEGAFRHRCRDTYVHDHAYYTGTTSTMPSLVFSAKGYRAAMSVIKLAGLAVHTATPREMDILDRRFVCLGCRPGQHGAWWGFKTLTWRQCIAHITQATYMCGNLNSDEFRILTPEEEQKSRTNTLTQHPYYNTADMEAWSCAHCNVHLDAWQTQIQVIQHVQNNHGIADPKVYCDVIVRPGIQYSKAIPHLGGEILEATREERQNFAQAPSDRMYICLQCPKERQTRLFILDGVQSHIRDVHKIGRPAQTVNTDFKHKDK